VGSLPRKPLLISSTKTCAELEIFFAGHKGFADMMIWLGRAGLATDSGTADESKEAELASALQKIVASPQEIGFSTGTRTVTISVCGVHNENDLRRLKSQIEELDGVGSAWIGPLKEGGVRGGSVTVEIEVENRVPLPALIQSVQALDEALLILPFKSSSWTWR
jgi:hypothetical protein